MALDNAAEVEALANEITECANAMHLRLMDAIKNGEVNQISAQAIFQDETILRQRANSLYLDAANRIVKDLKTPQAELLGAVNDAKKAMKKIKEIAQFIDLVADILLLAAAAYAAKPAPIVAALKEVKSDLDGLAKK
ncbi:hypothetical protein GCM10011613_32220 [Cellvibrio zantedeschiae]|uniref:Chemotaxis protein n=1 Tax=Cellvibrio zantedeschiae TaxID=1237077 RepID=A0ABQ3B9J7_9GAMM|nr:hypothetical protein [Cellvibrio zantedeschiae]GGY84752.1 hypothetical protein GCM10011613_32220 [Cellvibrio zantedeschiae]